ncbi:zonadhesin precursor [Rattus norvegicus]
MAPPVWTLMLLLVGAAWGQDQVPSPVWRPNSPDPELMVHTPREDYILSKCDFEDNSRPFCDWSQMSQDDGDWVRTTGPSLTGTSGPPGGYPNGEGYYLHMDPKTFPRGGVARLRSPDIWEQGPLCVHFAFHMFGLSWGAQLRLLLIRGRKHHRPYMLWKHVNTQSPSWMPTTVTVPADHDIPSWLMFEGVRGNTAYLDISLDGLSIQRGTCNRICMSQMCTFDTLNDLCGWSWVPTATGAKWTQKKGATGTLGVGPDEDFSNPSSGYYMLLDSTNARPGQKAVLLSPLSHSSGCLTLSFYYIMHGQGHDEGLFVYATFLGNIRKHSLFSGHPGPDWQAVSVNYTGQGQIQFMVVGVFGNNPEPAIAVDAISIAPCGESFPQCDFEDRNHPFCDWSQMYGDIGHWSWGSKSVPTPISGSPREFPYGGGHYIFFDSVKLSQEGQSARLVSPPFCAPGDICVEFSYHMYGLGKGTTLKLLLGSPAGSSPIPLWNRVGSQSSGWLNSSVTIPKGHQQPMQLFIEATRGTSTAFVVALNFILISHGPCRVLLQTEIPPSPLFPPAGPAVLTVPVLPTEEHTTPTEATTVPIEIATTPMEEITIPTEAATVPIRETIIPTEVTAIPTEVTTPTGEVVTDHMGVTYVSPEETSIPTTMIIPAEATTVSSEEITLATEAITVPTEMVIVSIELGGVTIVVTNIPPAETIPTEVTTVSPEETALLTEVTTVLPEETTVPTEATAVHMEATSVSPQETSVPPEETIPTEVTTVSPEETALLTEVTTVLPEETTVPTEATAVHMEATSVSPQETSVPPEETIPTEVTTVPPEEFILPTEVTTVPTEVTNVLPEDTTVPTEVTTVHMEATNVSPGEISVSPEETTATEVTTISPEEAILPTKVIILPIEEIAVPTEVTIVPTEVTIVPTGETTLPTEVATVPTEVTAVHMEATNVSPEETIHPEETIATDVTTLPTEVATVPTEVTAVHMETTNVSPEETIHPEETIATDVTTLPTEVATVPTEVTAVHMEATNVSPEETIHPEETIATDVTTLPTEVATVPTEVTAVHMEATNVSPEETIHPEETIATDVTTLPTEVATVPTEVTAVHMEATNVSPEETIHPEETIATDVTTLPTEVATVPTEVTAVHMEATNVSPEETIHPEETIATDVTTLPTEVATVPTEVTAVHMEATNVSPEETIHPEETIATDVTTLPTEVATVPTEVTAVHMEATNVSPEETIHPEETIATDVTTLPTEVATVPTEVTAVHMEATNVSPEETIHPEETIATDVTTLPTEVATVPTEVTAVHMEATNVSPEETIHPEEPIATDVTTLPTEVATVPTEVTAVHMEATNVSPEETIHPEETIATDVTTLPTEVATVPTEVTAVHMEATNVSPEETIHPEETIATDVTTVSPEETIATDVTTVYPEVTILLTGVATVPIEVPTVFTEVTTVPIGETTLPTEVPTVLTKVTTVPTEVTTVPTGETTLPTEVTTVTTGKTALPTEVPTVLTEVTGVHTEVTNISPEETSVPPEEIIPTEVTTLSPEETMFPTEVPTVLTEVTTVPTEVTTVLTKETTFPTAMPTVSTEVTNVSPEETSVPHEETIPTEITTVSPEEMVLPTEVTTVPIEVTTVPTEVLTVLTGKITIPTDITIVSTEVTGVHTDMTNVSPEETSIPPEEIIPTEVITFSLEETMFPTEVPTVSTEVAGVHTEVTTPPPEETTIPTEVTIVPPVSIPPEETTTPTEVSTTPPEETTIPTEVTTLLPVSIPPEETTIPTEVTTPPPVSIPPEETTTPTEVSTTPPEETTIPTEVTTVPPVIISPEETTTPTEVTTPPPEETTIPTEVTTVPPVSISPEETTTPTEVTTPPPEETTIPTEVTTVPPVSVPPEETTVHTEVTTVPTEGTTVPPEKTTIPSEETTVSTPETIFLTKQSTVIQTSTACRPPCPSPTLMPIGPSLLKPPVVSVIGMAPTTVNCPPNAHFELCACPASCENPKPSCQYPCIPGCICNPGFLFSNNQCINESSCNCPYDHKYYKPGEEWFSPNCTERCRCLPGSLMECQISQCGTHTICQLKSGQYQCEPYGGATCLVYGDLHFVTFDERHIGFTGTCTYILTETCSNSTDPFFRITASTQERGVDGVSSLGKVFITLQEMTITMDRGRHTLIGDQEVTLPAIPSDGIYVGLSGRFVELKTTFGLRVRWDGDQQLFVTVSSTYSGKLCGFCGNYDGDSSNDNLKSDGMMAYDSEELGQSWQVEKEEDEECLKKKIPPSCDPALVTTMLGPELCGQLVNPSGPFEACLLHLKASSFLDNCVTDMCSFQGLQQKLCAHMSAMTATCQDAGYPVKAWRGPEMCPLVCPKNSRYSLCANPCPDTCHPGSATQTCSDDCVEACECSPGFILSGFECVPASECGCISLQGRYFKVQEQWFNPDCKEICICESHNNIRCKPWKCKAQETCGHKNGILGCHAQGTATCIASGDPHYLTFDGALHHFMGTCTYVLTQPCWPKSQDNNFVVSATNEIRGGNMEVSYVKAVHVQVFDLKISLFKGQKVMVNNQRVVLPVWPSKGRVTIRMSGIFVLLYTNFGLQVRYDGRHLVEVTVPSSYTGSLCGLCGNYNNNSLDDNLRADMKPAVNSLLLGAAWKILEASDPGCFIVGVKASSCQESNVDDTWTRKCAVLMNPVGPFSNCHEVVPPQASFSSCVYDQCGTNGDDLTFCRSLQAYASLCAQAGQVITWRNSSFCPLRCPPRSNYSPCANSCPATCLTLSIPKDCPTLPCVEGCECERGHILSGTTCVPLRECGCSDQDGSYHLLGESWYTEKTCTTLCTCSVPSNITCSPTSCKANHVCLRQDGLLRCAAEVGECHISEDSQIVSFDDHSHPIQEACTYILVKVCHPSMNLPFFTISAKIDMIANSHETFRAYQLYIDIFNFHITLQKNHLVLISLINDSMITLPATTQIPGLSVMTEGVYTIVTIKDEILVKFESNNFLVIKIPATSNGKVCGVCGNFNGEEEDELMTPSDELAENEQEFMESWKDKNIDPNCQKIEEQSVHVEQQEVMHGKCRPIDFEQAQANCQTALQSPAWAHCSSRVPTKPFLLKCMNSFCEFGELFRALCDSLQSFEDSCRNQGLEPPIWRNSSFCPLECPAHSHYTNCLPSCLPSCLDPDSRCEGSGHKVPATCKEGCICQPDYVLNNDKCVLKSQCGCRDGKGVFTPEGKNWISNSCTQNCVCIGGTIECQNFQCPLGAQCRDNEDGSSTCVKISVQCPVHSIYTKCLPPCPPTCSNPDGHCEATSPDIPAICREGCLCQTGFVSDNDKCVPATECACKDTQRGFILAGKTWISEDCTQSCTCVKGTLRCRDFHCPSGTYCRNSTCVKIFLQCPAHSQFTDCLPPCHPSCSDPEGHCEGINTKGPSHCKEGCVCQSGYVLQDDKCVLKIECGCRDTQGGFILAGKNWTSRGCTQSCNCMEGVVRCQHFQCPSGTYCQDIADGTSNCATLQCPAHSSFTNCLPSCLPSCLDPEGHCEGFTTKGPFACKEGCVCEPGYVLLDDKCVPRIECGGCKDAQGVLISADKTWINKGCTQICTCVTGTIHCTNFQCPLGTYCKDIEDGNTNCTKISLQCPPHSLYTHCLPSCLPSCSDPEGLCGGTIQKVASTCREGCVCEPGYVLRNDKCVLKIECDCEDAHGVLIPADTIWINRGCTQTCTCMGGAIQCQNFKCPLDTYCKDIEDGNSNCTNIELHCPAHSHYSNCLPHCQPSCSDPDGHCEGSSTKAPSTCREGCVCEPDYVLNGNKCVLRIECGCKDTQGVLILEDTTWINRGCTRSCTCVGGAIQCQKHHCPSGTYCKDAEGDSSSCAPITLQCPAHSSFTNCLPSCLPSCSDPEGHCEGSTTKGPFACKEGCVCEPGYVLLDDKCVPRIECGGCKDAQGVLIPVDKIWINRGCTQTCTCMGGAIQCRKFQCPSGTYCKGIEDGNSNCTNIPLQCPAHSSFTNCLPSCLPSCSNMNVHCEESRPKALSTCKEGCVCHSGYVLYNEECIRRNRCGCKDGQGAVVPTGETWINKGCTQICTCVTGTIHCRKFQCPLGTYCKDIADGNSNCTNIHEGWQGSEEAVRFGADGHGYWEPNTVPPEDKPTLKCPAHSRYTHCLPSCPPSCSDPEGLCGGTSPKVPSTCKEGCICQLGYVIHMDKCVLRSHCGCKDTQGAFISADKTWISRGCTKSCTCTEGVIQCRNFQCPSGTYCKDSDNGSPNCTKITLQCPVDSQFTDCLPSCLPSCSNHCEVTSPNVPSICKEGCLCNHGFVFSEDACVPRTQCGCKDAHGGIIPAGKTWTSKDCTQTCTCIEGTIQCQNSQCPPETYCKDNGDGSSNCTKITLQCPAHSLFASCLPSCLPSCSDPEGLCGGTSPEVPSTCKEGCVCQSGYVLNSDKCVLRVECDCRDTQGALILAGNTWTSKGCTQSCTCIEGAIQCQNSQCPPGTYCKDSSDGSGSCVEITLQCPAHSLFTDCLPSCLPSCLHPDGLCKGVSPTVPSTCKEGCVCQSGYVLSNNKCILRNQCGCKDAHGVLIPEDKTLISRDCTQSCVCTEGSIQCLVFQCPPGTYCRDSGDGSGTCVKISLQCPANSRYTDCVPLCPPSCSDPEGRCEGPGPTVPSICKEGCLCHPGFVLDWDKCVPRIECGCKDTQGALIPAGKTWIPRGCTQSCTCIGGAVQCQNSECPPGTYCKDNIDGSGTCVKITLQCPAHSNYTDCLPTCLPSCLDPSAHCGEPSPKDPSTCKEGCVCQPGYMLDKDKCVLKVECSCRDNQGAVIPAGETWISKGCTQSCACMGGAVQCQNSQCPPGTYCKDSIDGSSNCTEITLQCPAHSYFTTCLPSCPASCSNLDGSCVESNFKAPFICKEGCICQPGYFLNNDKCVLRIQCGCKDAQGGLIPASRTWISAGCTESCTCVGGNIRCRNFQCPPGTYCKDSSDGSGSCVKITLQCPPHSRFTDCLPACPPSCTALDGQCEGISPKVPSPCTEGCLCQPGYVMHNHKCVLQIHCDCRDAHGGFIPAGKTWISSDCTQSCACVGGTVQCHNFTCPPGTQCQNSVCSKIIQCPVHSHYTACLPSCPPSCFDPEGLCWGTSPRTPSTCKEGCVCQPGYVLNEDKCVLRSHCVCKNNQGVLIPADKSWLTRGCIQNCTCKGGDIHCLNFKCPLGTECKDSVDGNSNCAKIVLQCPAHSYHTNCLPSCIPSCSNVNGRCEFTSLKNPSTCIEGCLCQSGFVFNKDKCVHRTQCGCKDSQGTLIPAGKNWITTGCSQRCTCTAGLVQCHDFECPSGTECQDIEDGNSNCAEITVQCPAHSHYSKCLPSCLPSCSDPDGLCKGTRPKASSTCEEGCVCQSGYVLSNDTCIRSSACTCKNTHGVLIPEGKTWVSRGCTKNCTCKGGTVQCQDFGCPTGSRCIDNKDGNSNCVTYALKCPAHSLYTHCLPSCLPSCSDPEGLCGGTSPEVPSTCKEGCFCRSGYVLHNNKCMLRIHCNCKDSQGSLIQVGQTRISSGCSQICECKKGSFQCQSFKCPSGTQCEENEDGSHNCVSSTMKCPANSLRTNCLPSCLRSCSNPDGHCEGTSHKTPSTCREGCVCRPGYLLDKDTCVRKDQCDCKDIKGDIIPAGKTWISSGCTQSCACTDGVIQCQNFICPSGSHCQHNDDGSSDCAANKLEKCTIFGDPYYHTFDGFTYRFLGRMNYYLIKTLDKLPRGIEPLIMEGRNKISPKGSSTLHEVTTIVYGYKIQLQEGLGVLVNNQKVSVPYNPNEHLRVILRAQRLLLATDFEMVLDFDGKHSAVISLPTTYRGLIRGLCGNYDKDQTNDFMLPSGEVTSNVHVFGNSWEVKVMHAFFRFPRALPEEGGREEEPDLLQSECSPEQTALIGSTQACRVLVDPQGPFAACHQIIAPEPFKQRCISDMCTGWKTKEEEELRCRVLGGYAIICRDAGANMTGWRDQAHCAMTCPANTVYQSCMTPCPATCAKFVTPKVCEGPCVEGCASLPGYIYSDTQSLPVTHCGCTTNGIYYKLGDSFVTNNCSQRCSCASRGILLCEPYGCRGGESCMVANFTRDCFRDSPCLQNPCHNDGRCEERGAAFICHCDFGYGGEFCTEPRDVTTRKKLEASSLVAILPGVLVMVLVPVLLPRVYVYMATRTTMARRRRKGEKLLRRSILRLEDTDVPEPTFKATEF